MLPPGARPSDYSRPPMHEHTSLPPGVLPMNRPSDMLREQEITPPGVLPPNRPSELSETPLDPLRKLLESSVRAYPDQSFEHSFMQRHFPNSPYRSMSEHDHNSRDDYADTSSEYDFLPSSSTGREVYYCHLCSYSGKKLKIIIFVVVVVVLLL